MIDAGEFKVTRTRGGLRLSQHGVVLSELRTSPGATHSVFDVLAAVIAVLEPKAPVGVLGFAGGSLMAPLRALGVEVPVSAVDLDRAGYVLFDRHCSGWSGKVNWTQGDAVEWLRSQAGGFGLLLDDLSVPVNGDVIKPAITWKVLPELIHVRLVPEGFGVFNLLTPPEHSWRSELQRIGARFKQARVVDLNDFENRILVGGADLPSARELGRRLRQALNQLRSRQAGRFRVRMLPSGFRALNP